MSGAEHATIEQELAYWREQLKKVDAVLTAPSLTLITLANHFLTGDPDAKTRMPSWISDSEVPRQTSLLVHALCCSTLQRLWRDRRRFDWLGKRQTQHLMRLKDWIAGSSMLLADPSSDVRALLSDPVFGSVNPLSAGEVFWNLLNAAENRTFSATGFVALAGMLWSLFATHSADENESFQDARTLAASITAKCLQPIKELQVTIRMRARLYREIRAVCRDLEDGSRLAAEPHHRWKFACAADRLSGLLRDLSDVAVNRDAFVIAADKVSARAGAMHAKDTTVPWSEIRTIVVDTFFNLRRRNREPLARAKRMLRVFEREIVTAINRKRPRNQTFAELRPLRPGEGPAAYRARMTRTAKRAIERCTTGLRELRNAVACCHALHHEQNPKQRCRAPRSLLPPQGADPLAWVLARLAVANESMADLIDEAADSAAQWCRHVVRQEVAYASAGNDTEFDAAELLSAVTISERWGTISDLEVDDAIAKALRGLRPDGSWATGQPIFLTKRVLGVWPNTSDIAWLLASAVRGRPKIRRADDALMAFIDWLDRNRTVIERFWEPSKPRGDDDEKVTLAGWSAETRETKTIDIWVTAGAVSALLEIRDLIEHRLWQLCETRFFVFRDLKQLDDIDPVDLGARHAHRLHHRLRTAARRSRGDDYASAEYSFVLHGPPGSSKTAMAEALGNEMWRNHGNERRVIRVTPADFTRQGEAGVDAEARFVFEILSHVRGITIIFDEIDDLLRRRELKGSPAFLKMVVPAMLNRLQDLRDAAPRQEICFILAMNYVDNVEPALVRPGRIDAAIPVVYPDPWSRENTLHRILPSRSVPPMFDERVRARIVAGTAGWPWATYNRLCHEIATALRGQTWERKGALQEKIDHLLQSFRTELHDPAAAYTDVSRWQPMSPPLINEVAHFALAFARTQSECSEAISRMLTESHEPAPATASVLLGKRRRYADETLEHAADQVIRKIATEWKREDRAEYSQAAAARTTAMGGTVVQVDDLAVFRVWAPGVDTVKVELLRDRDTVTEALDKESEGIWAGEIARAAAGDRYRYRLTTGNETYRRADPYGREVDDSVRYTILTEPRRPPRWRSYGWHELVIYQIHPGTFSGEQGHGTYGGIAQKLDDLQDLGVNAIELIGPGEYPTPDYATYDVARTRRIERGYGGMNALCDLIDQAHDKNIAVIAGITTQDFLGRPVADLQRFIGSDDVFFHPYLARTELGRRPDFGEPHVADLMCENAERWVREIGVDGIRWAGTNYVRTRSGESSEIDEVREGWSLMQRINRTVRGLGRNTLTIAQDLQEQSRIVSMADGCAGFGAQWSSRFEEAVRLTVTSRTPDLRELRRVFEKKYFDDAFWRVIYSESHETMRKRLRRLKKDLEYAKFDNGESIKRCFLAAALTLAAPGIPLLCQGQEFYDDLLLKPDRSLDWGERGKRAGFVKRFADLIACRRNRDLTTSGLTGHNVSCVIDAATFMFIVRRWDKYEEDSTVVVFNFGSVAQRNYPIHFPRRGTWLVRFNPDSEDYDKTFGVCESDPVNVAPDVGRISVGPASIIVLSHETSGHHL